MKYAVALGAALVTLAAGALAESVTRSEANNGNLVMENVPMFVVQGENDPRVPVTEATQMVAALRAHGNTVWYMNALNEGHGYRKKENRDIFQQATVLFLRQHLVDRE